MMMGGYDDGWGVMSVGMMVGDDGGGDDGWGDDGCDGVGVMMGGVMMMVVGDDGCG